MRRRSFFTYTIMAATSIMAGGVIFSADPPSKKTLPVREIIDEKVLLIGVLGQPLSEMIRSREAGRSRRRAAPNPTALCISPSPASMGDN